MNMTGTPLTLLLGLRSTVFRALVNCWSPEEVCGAFDLAFGQGYEERRVLEERILKDMASAPLDCHLQLAHDLMAALSVLKGPKRVSCGLFLGRMAPLLDPSSRREIVAALLSSGVKAIRERAYSVLIRSWDPAFTARVAELWDRHGDQGCARLILNHFGPDFVRPRFAALAAVLGPEHRPVYIEAARRDPGVLDAIARWDEITYVYVLAKLGRTLSTGDALSILERHAEHCDIGLLVWSYGQMHLREALERIGELIRDFESEWERTVTLAYQDGREDNGETDGRTPAEMSAL